MKSLRLTVLLGLLLGCAAIVPTLAGEPAPSRLEVFYFHRTLRCPSCINMENFTAGALGRFPTDREAGRLLWRVVNLDADSDKHFEQDYALEFNSVVLSRYVQGQEVAWTNLPNVWELVGDKQNFIAYVEMEIAKQLEQLPKE
jgi:hypothetical protein